MALSRCFFEVYISNVANWGFLTLTLLFKNDGIKMWVQNGETVSFAAAGSFAILEGCNNICT